MRIRELYNVMSVLLRKLEDIVSERDFERMRNLTTDYEADIIKKLKKMFPDMFDQDANNVAEISEWKLSGSSLVMDLEEYLMVSNNKDELVFLAKCLDLFLEDTFYSCMDADQETCHFQCLNTNYRECRICLLPRLACRWEHQSRDAYTSYNIFYYLRNFYYVCADDLKEYEMCHILMPKNLFREAIRREELRIMVSPVSGNRIIEVEEPYEREHVQYVSVRPIEADMEKRLRKTILNVLKEAISSEADILLYPEMLGSPYIMEELSYELAMREQSEDNDFPCLVIGPTVWREHRNSCRIMDDMGEAVCEQQKHHGVDLKQWSAKEDIMSDRKIYILHCHGIGRIAVAVCKDFLVTSYLKMLVEKLKVNLLLVPSFTGRDYQFEMLKSKYKEVDCNVIWVNTCSSRWLNKNGRMQSSVTMGCFPGKHGVKETKITLDDLHSSKQQHEKACVYTYRIGLY